MFELFDRMNDSGILYAVLRNYGTLPEVPDPNGDVDILIPENQAVFFHRILKKSLEETGGKIFFTRHRFHCTSYFIFIPGQPAFATWIDAFTMIATRGVPWLDTGSILLDRIRHQRGFFILSPGAEAATLFMKEILAKRPLKPKYQEQIIELLKKTGSPEIFRRLLSTYFGEKHATSMFDLAKQSKWDEAFQKRKEWWRILLAFTFRKELLRQIGRFFLFFTGHMVQTFFQSCRGGIIAVLGPDGVGKTTACHNLQERLKKWPFRKVLVYHGEFGVFPSLGKIYRWITKPWQKASAEEFSRHQTAGSLRAFIHLIYYGLEFFLAWPFVLWGRWRGNCFIFDRYYYDFSLRPTHRWLYRLITKLIPSPDLIIILKAPPAIIYERKQELSFSQIEDQLGEFPKQHPNAMILSTDQPPSALVSKMEEAAAVQFSKKS